MAALTAARNTPEALGPVRRLPLSGYEEQQGIAEWPLSFSPQPTAGNDQWKLTLN